MTNFEDDIKNLSIDEINELYNDIIETPDPLIGGIATYCDPKAGWNYGD